MPSRVFCDTRITCVVHLCFFCLPPSVPLTCDAYLEYAMQVFVNLFLLLGNALIEWPKKKAFSECGKWSGDVFKVYLRRAMPKCSAALPKGFFIFFGPPPECILCLVLLLLRAALWVSKWLFCPLIFASDSWDVCLVNLIFMTHASHVDQITG